MISLRQRQFLVGLVLVLVCLSALGQEPNEVKTELKFEIDNKRSQLWISDRPGQRPGLGPIKPTHVAVFYIRRPSVDLPAGSGGILQILKTSAGQSLSEQQRQFLTASDAVVWWGIEDVQNHDMVLLYAVSEEDAKKTVRAYLEVAINKAKAKMQDVETHFHELDEKIAKAKKELPEKQEQAKAAESKYKEVKNAQYHSSLGEADAFEKAKETMLQMGRMLDVLEIELAGIREKLGAIEEYRKSKRLRDNPLSDETVDKLEQMFVEQMIELRSAEARKQAALRIRAREKAFLDFSDRWINLEVEVDGLRRSLSDSESGLRKLEGMLANPTPDMLPPKVYQNKVTIYPVRVED